MEEPIVIFSFLILIFLTVATLLFKANRKMNEQIKNWYYTKTGVITDKIVYAKPVSPTKNNQRSDAVRPTVKYFVDGKKYEYTSDKGQNPQLRPCKKVGVYYNPKNPNDAFIDTFAQRESFLKVVANFFLLFGLGFIYVLYKMVTE